MTPNPDIGQQVDPEWHTAASGVGMLLSKASSASLLSMSSGSRLRPPYMVRTLARKTVLMPHCSLYTPQGEEQDSLSCEC